MWNHSHPCAVQLKTRLGITAQMTLPVPEAAVRSLLQSTGCTVHTGCNFCNCSAPAPHRGKENVVLLLLSTSLCSEF